MNKWRVVFQIMYCAMVLSLLVVLSGCTDMNAHLRSMSAGQIGCSPDEITIKDINSTAGIVTGWTAICEGKTFYCTSASSGNSCKEALKRKTKNKK